MDKELTPEEKLLRLIKRPQGEAKKQDPASRSKKKPPAQVPAKRKARRLDITLNTILLVALAVILVGFTGAQILKMAFSSRDLTGISIKADLPAAGKQRTRVEPKTKPLSHYTNQIKKRQLFKPLVIEKPKVVAKEPEIKIEDVAKGLTLMGIVDGNPPQAIIEDSKIKQTHFVSEKDKIGKMTVGEVKNGRVTLKLGDQTFNLSL